MTKKGFTLVELMVVITVLGLIALLIAPTIINQIRNSKNKIDSVTEKLIYSAADLYLDNKESDYPKNNGSTYCLTLRDLVEDGKLSNPVLDSNGDEISLDKMIQVKVSANNYNYKITDSCVNPIKIEEIVLSDENITLGIGLSKTISVDVSPKSATNVALKWTSGDENIATVVNGKITGISKGITTITVSTTDGSNISKTINVTVSGIINGIMASESECIKNTNLICPAGTLVNVQVNDNKNYNFYVIKDTGAKLTLIMDRNLGDKVEWISKADYNNDANYGTNANINKGPITALNYLNSQINSKVETWTNIGSMESYEYYNNKNGTTNTYGYQKLTITNGAGVLISQDGTTTNLTGTMRARLITEEEVKTLKDNSSDGSTPTWLYVNLDSSNTTEKLYGYWLLSSSMWMVDDSPEVYSCFQAVVSDGNVYCGKFDESGSITVGVRPVIELSK